MENSVLLFHKYTYLCVLIGNNVLNNSYSEPL